VFESPARIIVKAEASATLATISKVEFFDDFIKFGESTTAPYTADFCSPSAGQHKLRARATSSSGETRDACVTITVLDKIAPTIIPPPTQIAEAQVFGGANVSWPDAIVDDNLPGEITVSYSPNKGSLFRLGTTLVTVTATDDSGNTSTANFNVIVRDTIPPVVTVPPPPGIVIAGTTPTGGTAYFTTSAHDNVSGDLKPTTSINSGSVFPFGTTIVVAQATDSSGNTGFAAFNVTVTGAPTLVSDLRPYVSLDSPTANQVFNLATVTFTGQVLDDNGPENVRVDILANGSVVGSANARADGTFSVPTSISNGHLPVKARATDTVNQTQSETASRFIWIDTQSPRDVVLNIVGSSTATLPNVFTSPGWLNGTVRDPGAQATGIATFDLANSANVFKPGYVARAGSGVFSWNAPIIFPPSAGVIKTGPPSANPQYRTFDEAGNVANGTAGTVYWAPIILQPGNNGRIAIQKGDEILIGADASSASWVLEVEGGAATDTDCDTLKLTAANGSSTGVGANLRNKTDCSRLKYGNVGKALPIEMALFDELGNPLRKDGTTDNGKDFWASVDVFDVSLTVAADGSHQARTLIDIVPDSNPPAIQSSVTTDDVNLIALNIKPPSNGDKSLTGNVTVTVVAPGLQNGFGNVRLWYDPNSMGKPPATTTLTPAADSGLVLDITKIDSTGKTIYVQGVSPSHGVNDIAVVAEFDPGNGYVYKKVCKDLVMVTIGSSTVDLPTSNVYQLEIARLNFQTNAPDSQTQNWFVEVDANQTAVQVLSPFRRDLVPFSSSLPASPGKVRYPYFTTFRVLGSTTVEQTVNFRVLFGPGINADFIDFPILAIPLNMKQLVDAPVYGKFESPEQPYGLMGHTGLLTARSQENTLVDERVNFANFKWDIVPSSSGITSVNTRGPIQGNPLAIQLEGWRPGSNSIRATNPASGDELGRWIVTSDDVIIHQPHFGQLEVAISNAIGDSSGPIPQPQDQPIDDPATLVWSTKTVSTLHAIRPISRSLRLLETQHRNAEFVLTQITNPEAHPVDDLQVFSWSSDIRLGFTSAQAKAIFATAYETEASPTPYTSGPRQNLVHRLNNYNTFSSPGAGTNNSDLIRPLKTLARINMDSALLAILKQGVSLNLDPEDYLTYAGAFANDLNRTFTMAPGYNMYRATWSNPTWLDTVFGTDMDNVTNLFVSSGAPNWQVPHPYTRELLKHMISQRSDLAREVFKQVSNRFENFEVSINDSDENVVSTWRTITINPDLTWDSKSFSTFSSGQPAYYHGSVFNPNSVTKIVGAPGQQVIETLHDSPLRDMRPLGSDAADSVFCAAVSESLHISDVFTQLDTIQNWQSWRNAIAIWSGSEAVGKLGVNALWIGTWFGIDQMYQAQYGAHFLTDEPLTTTERLLSVGFAALSVADIAIPVAKGAARVMKGLARGLGKSSVEKAANTVAKDFITETVVFAGTAERVTLTGDMVENATRKGLQSADVLEKSIAQDTATNIEETYVVRTATKSGSVTLDVGLAMRAEQNALVGSVDEAGNLLSARVGELKQTIRDLKSVNKEFWDSETIRAYFENACFVAGTAISMADGAHVPIERIQVGDRILSRDQTNSTGNVVAVVTQTYAHATDDVRIVHVNVFPPHSSRSNGVGVEDSLVTTDNHPFWIVGKGWTAAKEIQIGDSLSTCGENHAVCISNEHKAHPGGVVVYNLEVAGTHTYFAGTTGIWVHNLCAGEKKYREYLEAKGITFDLRVTSEAEKFHRLYVTEVLQPAVIDGRKKNLFRGMTRENIKENTRRLYKSKQEEYLASLDNTLGKNWEAHHVCPVDDSLGLEQKFFMADINIHDPNYAVPLSVAEHDLPPLGHGAYNRDWDKFFKSFPPGTSPSKQDVIDKGKVLAKKYKFYDNLPPWSPFR
jgi:hypothetical protein